MKFKYWRETVMGLLAVGLIVSVASKQESAKDMQIAALSNENVTLTQSLQASTQRVLALNKELAETRVKFVPKEFASVEDFRFWAASQQYPKAQEPSLDWVVSAQAEALKTGRIIGYELVKNPASQKMEWWPMAKIGGEVWYIEPLTGNVEQIWPWKWNNESPTDLLGGIKLPSFGGK